MSLCYYNRIEFERMQTPFDKTSSIKKLLRLGLHYFWLKITGRIKGFSGKLRAKIFGTEISDLEFRNSLLSGFREGKHLFSYFTARESRTFFVDPRYKDEYLDALRRLCPGAETAILRAADSVCEHRFDLLGSGPIDLGWPLDWHADFKSGFRWNPGLYYTDIRPAPYPGGYDLKVPWELSRCQHFAWLGQAYWLTGDEKYVREYRAEVMDWIRQNPPEFGVNWACSMDIAIRAVNWLWGYAFFQDSPILDDHFRFLFSKSLLCHGRHIRSNLEKTATFTGNHYLSDIVGLVYLGILLPEFRDASEWRKFALRELEIEMSSQVNPDGGNFEASTSYHRLAAELFLSATLLARSSGHDFGEKYMTRLAGMIEYIYRITKPDGAVPIIGDQDNGRLHRLKVWENQDREWRDFRPLLAVGCVLFNRPDWGKMAYGHWEEAIWFYGIEALAVHERSMQYPETQMQSTGFEDTGLYIMRADDIYVAVDLGSVGQNGKGGHAHNDIMSFELFASDCTWIQDPGTYVYTPDYEARNLFRSTAYHNTVAFPGIEQNAMFPLSLFAMKEESHCRRLVWEAEPNLFSYLAGEYRRYSNPKVVHRRSFFLSNQARILMITDWVSGVDTKGQRVFHFSPYVKIEDYQGLDTSLKVSNPHGQTVLIHSYSGDILEIRISDGWVSESYGVRKPGKTAWLSIRPEIPYKTIVVFPGNEDVSKRIHDAQNLEALRAGSDNDPRF